MGIKEKLIAKYNHDVFDWCYQCFEIGAVVIPGSKTSDLLKDLIVTIRECDDHTYTFFRQGTTTDFEFAIPLEWLQEWLEANRELKDLVGKGLISLIENHISELIDVRFCGEVALELVVKFNTAANFNEIEAARIEEGIYS